MSVVSTDLGNDICSSGDPDFPTGKRGADLGGGVMGQFTGMVTRCWALWKRNVYGRCMKVKGVTPVYYGHAVCDSGAE